jgi:uncharacterized protein involved in exopolysaccharide biosynthesis
MTNDSLNTDIHPGCTLSPRADDVVSILDLLIVLAERKRIILSCTLSFAVFSAIISLFLPPRYTATITILPPQQTSSMSSALMSQFGGMAQLAGGSLGIKNPNDMYVAMLRSQTVENAVVQKYGLQQEYHVRFPSDACRDLERHTRIEGSGKDGLIHLSFTDRDPNRAAALANGYIDQYQSFSQHLAITEAAQRRLFFQQQLEQAKNQLFYSEDALKGAEQKSGVIEVASQSRALIELASSLRAKIAAQEIQIQGMQTYATGQNTQLVQAQQELARMRGELAKLGGSEDSSDSLSMSKDKVTEAGLEYLRKLRDVKYNETIFELLAKQFELAKLDEAKEGSMIQIVDFAVVPDKRTFPRRGLIVICSTFAGLLAGILLAILLSARQRIREIPALEGKLSVLQARLLSGKRVD